MLIKALAIVMVVALSLSAYLWVRVDRLVLLNEQLSADAERYAMTAKSNAATIAALEDSAVKKDKLLAEHHAINQALQLTLQSKQRQLIELSKSDEDVKEWAGDDVPSSIDRVLSQATSDSQD